MINDRDIVNAINYSDFCKATGISEEYAKKLTAVLLDKEYPNGGDMLAAITYIRSQLDQIVSALNTIDMNLYSPLLQEEIKTEVLVALLSGDIHRLKNGLKKKIRSIVKSPYPTMPIDDFDFPAELKDNDDFVPSVMEDVQFADHDDISSYDNKTIKNLSQLLKKLGIKTSSTIDIQGVQVPTKVVLCYFPYILERFCDEIKKHYAEGMKLEYLLPPIIEDDEEIAIIALHKKNEEKTQRSKLVEYNNRYKKALAFLKKLKEKKSHFDEVILQDNYVLYINSIVIREGSNLTEFILSMIDIHRNSLLGKEYNEFKVAFSNHGRVSALMPLIINYYDNISNKGKLFPLKKLEEFLSSSTL